MSTALARAERKPTQEFDAAVRAAGAPAALLLAETTLRVQRLLTAQEAWESESYAELGHTWETYCRSFHGKGSDAVEEEIRSLDTLGPELFAAAQFAGLKRSDFRRLRSLSPGERPEVLPSGEGIAVGDLVIPLDAEHRDQVVQAFTDLLLAERGDRKAAETSATDAAAKLAEVEANLAKARATIEAGEKDLEVKARQLNSIELLRGQLLSADAPIDECVHRLVQLGAHITVVADMIEATHPDRDVINRAARLCHYPLSRVLAYSGGLADDPGPPPTESGTVALDFAALEAELGANPDEEI